MQQDGENQPNTYRGYPSRSSEAGGLLKDQFVRPPKSQAKWYNFAANPEKCNQGAPQTVTTWNTDASKVNSSYSRIAKAAGIASTPPASRQISQDNLRRWEKLAREASTTCNQAAAFNRCLYKVQENMQAELKTVKSELSKGKSAGKITRATEEMQFLMNFNSSITQCMAKTLEHLTDFVFVMVANTTLIRRDSYLSHLKMGIKPDTLAALRTGPLHTATLFPDSALKQAEEDIANFESKSHSQSGRKVASIHTNGRKNVRITGNQTVRLGRTLVTRGRVRRKEKPHSTHRDQPRASSHLNDNQCITSLQRELLARNKTLMQEKTLNVVNFHVVTDVPSAPGHSQKRELSPGAADCQITKSHRLKYVKVASCVTQLSCVQSVNNAQNAALNLPVGSRLQKFWELG